MIEKTITDTDLEAVYDMLAEAIDATEPERRTLFLAKLALVLANRVGDAGQFAEAVAAAKRDL